jgi:hypothetical protein
MEGKAAGNLIENLGDIGDWVGPGFERGEVNGVGLGVIELSTEAFDLGVEGAEAEVEAFGSADVVVLRGGKAGKAEQVAGSGRGG